MQQKCNFLSRLHCFIRARSEYILDFENVRVGYCPNFSSHLAVRLNLDLFVDRGQIESLRHLDADFAVVGEAMGWDETDLVARDLLNGPAGRGDRDVGDGTRLEVICLDLLTLFRIGNQLG